MREHNLRRTCDRGQLVRLLYRLGHQAASGLLTITASGARAEVFVLRRGAAIVAGGDTELAKRVLAARLARLVAIDRVVVLFEGGVAASPPGAQCRLSLSAWARAHLEHQLDGALADALAHELAGIRLSVRADVAPDPADDADRRMLVAMAHPRRLDQIWPLARTPRFRLLAFLHFLRAIGVLELEGVVAERSAPSRVIDPRLDAARRVLGLDVDADREDVKRAYRRLARSLHPDLQPQADAAQRRDLERRFAEVTAAYETLI